MWSSLVVCLMLTSAILIISMLDFRPGGWTGLVPISEEFHIFESVFLIACFVPSAAAVRIGCYTR